MSKVFVLNCKKIYYNDLLLFSEKAYPQRELKVKFGGLNNRKIVIQDLSPHGLRSVIEHDP